MKGSDGLRDTIINDNIPLTSPQRVRQALELLLPYKAQIHFKTANGLMGPQIVATDSFITLINCAARLISFRQLGLLNNETIFFGSLIGSVAIFGSYVARKIADKLGVKLHTVIIEVCVVLGGSVMIYRAFTF